MKKNMDNNGLNIDFNQMIETDTGKIIEEEVVVEDPTKDPPEVEEEIDERFEVDIDGEEKKKESSKEESAKVEKGTSSLPLKVLVNALHEKGVLSELDTEALENATEDEAELLITLIKGEIDKNINSYKEDLPTVIKNLIDNYEENVPLDKLIGLKSQEMRLDGITEEQLKENVDLMKAVIHDNYKNMGLTDAKINKRIQQFEDLGQLEEESKDALIEAKERIKVAQEEEKATAKRRVKEDEKRRVSSLDSLKEDINSTAELINGVKITDREKEIIYDSMTKPIEKDKSGNPLNAVMVTRAKNPMGFEKLLHYYHSLGLFNIDDKGNLIPDVSKIKAGAKASAMDSLTSALKKRQSSSSGLPARTSTVDDEKMKANLAALKRAVS